MRKQPASGAKLSLFPPSDACFEKMGKCSCWQEVIIIIRIIIIKLDFQSIFFIIIG